MHTNITFEVETDMAREENQVTKIRELVKERNKMRAQRQRKAPASKRRKLDDQSFEPRQEADTDHT